MNITSRLKALSRGRLLVFAIVITVMAAVPLLACAFARSTAANLTVVNNSSSWTIQHLYLSPVDQDNWGPDQLNGAAINPGSSHSLGLACSSSIKVITEDQNGCFLYQTVSCGENSTWTVTDSATPNCGH